MRNNVHVLYVYRAWLDLSIDRFIFCLHDTIHFGWNPFHSIFDSSSVESTTITQKCIRVIWLYSDRIGSIRIDFRMRYDATRVDTIWIELCMIRGIQQKTANQFVRRNKWCTLNSKQRFADPSTFIRSADLCLAQQITAKMVMTTNYIPLKFCLLFWKMC